MSIPKIQMINRIIQMICLLLIIILFIGCALFQPTRRLNLEPFADNLIAITADIQKGLADKWSIYTREYINGPKVEEFQVYLYKVRAILRGVIGYSVEIVTLGQSQLNGKERANMLADYIVGLNRPVLREPVPDLNISRAQMDAIVMRIRKQEKLLDALNAAQPIIDEVTRVSADILEKTNQTLTATIYDIEERMIADNRSFLDANRNLKNAQVATLANFEYLHNYRQGDKNAIDTLMLKEPSLLEVVKNKNNLTSADIRAIEDRLLYKLTAINDIRKQFEPDLIWYWKQQNELDDLAATYRAALRKARIALIGWTRAHGQLAQGITDPAKIDVLNMAKKAANAVSPIDF